MDRHVNAPEGTRRRIDGVMVVAAFAFFGLVFVAFFGDRIAPYEQIYFVVEHGGDPRPYDPGLVFPFGSDVLGRDLFSLVLIGARTTLTIVLLAGLARVLAGVLVAAIGGWWRPTRLLTETIAELAAAVPATLVALLLIKAFVKTDTSVPVIIGALLLTGWAGPYRVIRAEVDRLAHAPFNEGARVIGLTPSRVFWRHQLPHLVPLIAVNLSQQIVASLVLVAELGVLGVLVSAVRSINIAESQTAIRLGPPMSALVPDVPEWGAMLSSSRTIEVLWLTRWVIFVPGAAFALTAIGVALIGFAIARRYARRDFMCDLRSGAVVIVAVVMLFLISGLIPERYVEAREWATAARHGLSPVSDMRGEFEGAGLHSRSVIATSTTIDRAGPASVTIGSASVVELFPRPAGPPPDTIQVQSYVRAGTGGGVLEAPLVFAARGIAPSSPSFLQLNRTGFRSAPDLAPLIREYPDDYAGIEVRGKVLLLVRFTGVDAGDAGFAFGPPVGDSITEAINRGAAAVLFVDPDLGVYRDREQLGQRVTINPYLRLEREFPAVRTSGVPVVVLSPAAAQSLVAGLGVDISPFLGADQRGRKWERSAARDLGVLARVEVPLRAETVAVPSLVAEVPNIPEDAGRIVVFAARDLGMNGIEPARAEVLAAIARLVRARELPFIFVDFDPRADTRALREALDRHRLLVVLILGRLDGDELKFDTANGDLIPAFDLYAERAGVRYEVRRKTTAGETFLTPVPGIKTILIRAQGPSGDARGDAAALIGYLAGRLALGAPELGR